MICWMRYVQYSAVLESRDLRFIGLGNSKHDEFSRAFGFYEQTPRNGTRPLLEQILCNTSPDL